MIILMRSVSYCKFDNKCPLVNRSIFDVHQQREVTFSVYEKILPKKYYQGDVQGAELPNHIGGLGSMEHRNGYVVEFPLTYISSCKR
jgi:hypothetical protein